MKLTYAGVTTAGTVRTNNEDSLQFWQPATIEEMRARGAVAILADGVGGHGSGEVASRLACENALNVFKSAASNLTPSRLLFQMFSAANLAVYEAGMNSGDERRMMTTLTICLFRNKEITIGHVGDCRAYVVRYGRIRRITSDHSYAGVQLKLGLVTAEEAAKSQLRSVLTRSVGQDPVIGVDYHTIPVNRGDRIVQCTDGLWCYVSEREIYDVAAKSAPQDACRQLIELGERRGSDDNMTAQVIQIESIEIPQFYRGVPIYQKANVDAMGSEPEVGQSLDGRYNITDLISRSGMASIFKAIDTRDNRIVALKIPFAHYESDPGFYSRFKREQEIGVALNHPYILRVDPDDGGRSRPYLVMELLEGQTLGHLMRSVRPFPEADAMKIISRVCEGLHYMHEHDVVHRDLKPENIMICNDGSIRIMDFGIAKYEGQRRLTFGGFTPTMGTPDYMAPEQVRGKRGDRRTDIYSLGTILYEMLTGAAPFDGTNPFAIMNARLIGDPIAPRQKNPEISPAAEEIVLHAMARNPADRYATAMEFKNELDHPDQVQVTGRAQRLEAPAPWKSRRRWSRIAVIIVAALVLGFLAVVVGRHLQWK
jgi:serine/threonine protein phosphatase PrpC